MSGIGPVSRNEKLWLNLKKSNQFGLIFHIWCAITVKSEATYKSEPIAIKFGRDIFELYLMSGIKEEESCGVYFSNVRDFNTKSVETLI